ncbi:inositol 1,4,5-triphosphate receptor associated 2 isoform X2 [Synchiropus splendidus]|uniref:inositol 1,4,5-triphosphate receptor associated 2 isoform X2 n=1 Tax=Synchiropus splendidus TaxID=270530 RepID=UPI00237D7692|nr:inositol 1,4,5-triphosphate receptor associated 2 isoform X2 [Synchiropus splendidus]
MDFYTPQPNRRHNPVDSICRKLQTIQWRGDREPNSPFQIPKLSSSNYDSPQCGLRHNLEVLLKKGSKCPDESENRKEKAMGMPVPTPSKKNHHPSVPLSIPSTPACTPSVPANITYTITSTLGERRGADGSDLTHIKTWKRYCSTPTGQTKDKEPYFTFTRGPQSVQQDNEQPDKTSKFQQTFTPSSSTVSYNLNFTSNETGNLTEYDMPYPALVVKRLSMGEAGNSQANDTRKDTMAGINLICEENLLDTIFHACDTQRRGKVYVSHIVDYLRHTTSRTSEDSGLVELCNMLDPEQKDVSIDLDTYHAVMREWIEDCRNNVEDSSQDVTQESVKLKDCLSAKRSLLLNMTSGSLEAFGGEASRVEFETSELVYCVSDLQLSNQKLQEEVKRLKQVVEGMEDSNQKLAEENEELRNQARMHQQLAQKEKMLYDEVEEMKATLSCTEEGRARASAHVKHMEKENQSLIAKIASLQEENFKVTMEMDGFQRRIGELRNINADLEVQIHSFDGVISDKDSQIQEKNRQITELNAAVEEYTSLTELLRADKSRLENQMQMLYPELAAGLSLSVAYRLNHSTSGSLQTELALAQLPPETSHESEHLSTTMSFASPLDETLDKEVLLMLHGPNPEHMALEFKNLLNKMKSEFNEEASTVLSTLRVIHQPDGNNETGLQTLQAELDARRSNWAQSLDQLAQYTDSLEKELIKMASNMRRSRTEMLHLSVRVQEQENQKRQLSEELEQLKTPQESREASCQTPLPEEEIDDLDWDEEFALQDFLKSQVAETNCRERRADSRSEDRLDKVTEGEEKWTVVDGTVDREARDTSTPLSVLTRDPGESPVRAGDNNSEVDDQPGQSEASVPALAPAQAVSDAPTEVLMLTHPSHSEDSTQAETCDATVVSSEGSNPNLSCSTVQNSTPSPATSLAAEVVPPSSMQGEPHESQSESQLTSGLEVQEEKKDCTVEPSLADMSRAKSLSQDPHLDRSAAEDSINLLPVVMEEEDSVQGTGADSSAIVSKMEGSDPQTGSGATILPGESSTSAGERGSGTSDKDASSTATLDSTPGKQTMSPNKEGPKMQGDLSETSVTSEKESEVAVISDPGENFREDKSGLSANEKEIETEFQRLALGFKCDMFTLEKRLRLEERSRDLAEENVRREVSSCQGLLQALIPLCEDDNQSMEIIQRLQKNLDILTQSMTRVSSRSEMLGAIHQESRIGKAVEVMIQHVENLRRMYTKEHAELLELRETLMQNERSFGSHTERDDFRAKKQSASQYYKSSSRRVSIAALPRSSGGNMHFDISKTQDGADGESERLTRRSPWTMSGKNSARPPLKRFVSSAAWVESEDPSLMMKGTPAEEERKEELVAERRRSSLSELGNKLTSLMLPFKTPGSSSSPTSTDAGLSQSLVHGLSTSRTASAAAVARGSRGVWLWLAMVLLLAGLLALLAGLMMQPAVDAAPVGTGDSWMTIQQLLWPYTGLRHHGQPPV